MKKACLIILALLISVVFASTGFTQEKAAPATPPPAVGSEKVVAPEKAAPEKKAKKTKKAKKPKKAKKAKKAQEEKAPEAASAK